MEENTFQLIKNGKYFVVFKTNTLKNDHNKIAQTNPRYSKPVPNNLLDIFFYF